jgi:hypothetical protein
MSEGRLGSWSLRLFLIVRPLMMASHIDRRRSPGATHYVSIRTSKMTGHLFPVRKKVPRSLE